METTNPIVDGNSLVYDFNSLHPDEDSSSRGGSDTPRSVSDYSSSMIVPLEDLGEMVSYKLQELEKKLASDISKIRNTYSTFQQAVEDTLWPKQSDLIARHHQMKESINTSMQYFLGLNSTINEDLSEAITASGPPHKRIAVLLTLHEIFFSIFYANYIHNAFLCNDNKLIVDNKNRIDILTLYRDIMKYAGTYIVTDMTEVEKCIQGFIQRFSTITKNDHEKTGKEHVFCQYSVLTAHHLVALVERIQTKNSFDAQVLTDVQKLKSFQLPEIDVESEDDGSSSSKQDVVLHGRFVLSPWTAGSYLSYLMYDYEGTQAATESLTKITKEAVGLARDYITPLLHRIKNPLEESTRCKGDFSLDLKKVESLFYTFVDDFHRTKVDGYALECGNHLLGLSSYLHFLAIMTELDRTSIKTPIMKILEEEKELFTMLKEEVNRSEIDKDASKSYTHIRRFAELIYRETRWDTLENTPSGFFLNNTAGFINNLLSGVLREYQEAFLKVTEIEKRSWKEIKRRSDNCIVLQKSPEDAFLVTHILSLKGGVLGDGIKSFIVKEITNAIQTEAVSPRLDLLLYTLCTDPKYKIVLKNTRQQDAFFSKICDHFIPQDFSLDHDVQRSRDTRKFGTLQFTMDELKTLNEIVQELAIAKDTGNILAYAKAVVGFSEFFNQDRESKVQSPFEVLIESAIQKAAKKHNFPQEQNENGTLDENLELPEGDISSFKPNVYEAFFSIARAIYSNKEMRWGVLATFNINDCTEEKMKGGSFLSAELFKRISLEGQLCEFSTDRDTDEYKQLKVQLKAGFIRSHEFENFIRTKSGTNELQKAVYMAVQDEYREGNTNKKLYRVSKSMKIIDILEHHWGREYVVQWMTSEEVQDRIHEKDLQ